MCILPILLGSPPDYYDGAIIRSTNGGQSWEPPSLLGGYDPEAIAARDSLVYIYSEYATANGDTVKGALLRSTNYGVSWDTIRNLPTIGSRANLLATTGTLHLVISKRPPGVEYEVIYRRSTNLGQSFSLPETLSINDGFISDESDIDGDDQGNIYVTWREARFGSIDGYHAHVALRKSTDNGTTWEAEQLLTYTPTALFPVLSVKDSAVAVAWNEYIDGNNDKPMMRISKDQSATWCDTGAINILGGDVDISIQNNVIFSVYGKYITGFTNSEIFYRRGLSIGYQSGDLTVSFDVSPKWNLVSVPLSVSNPYKSTLFPSAVSDAFYFNNGSYVSSKTLQNRIGYWLKFNNNETINVQGSLILRDTFDLVQGWNLIGSITIGIPLNQISTIPTGIITSSFYTFENGYVRSDRIEPGKAYWVKVNTQGKLILDGSLTILKPLLPSRDRSPPR